MNKPEIIELMNRMRNANARFDALRKSHNADEVAALKRLVLEGAAQYMSAEQMAEETGATVRRIRLVMRVLNLDPRRKPSVLSKHAATVLEENATLLGIEPAEMNFMSPLAYLPMGEEMRKQINVQAAQGVTEVEDVLVALGTWCRNCNGYEDFDDFDDFEGDRCSACGCEVADHVHVRVTES